MFFFPFLLISIFINLINKSSSQVTLSLPIQIWVDTSNTAYFAEGGGQVIRQIDTSKNYMLNVTAGTGMSPPSTVVTDNISATDASLAYPYGVWGTTDGTLYISDSSHHKLRKINKLTKIITSMAGISPPGGYNGDEIPATSASLYNNCAAIGDSLALSIFIADTYNNRFRRLDTSTGLIHTVGGTGGTGYNQDDIPATTATFASPYGAWLTTDSGKLYVCDSYNMRVRMIDLTSGVVRALGGNTQGFNGEAVRASSAQFSYPINLFGDTVNRLYVADAFNCRIRRIDLITTIVTTVVGSNGVGYSGDHQLATSTYLHFPYGVFVTPIGEIYLTDTFSGIVRYVNTSGYISTIAGFLPAITTRNPTFQPTVTPSLPSTIRPTVVATSAPSLHPTLRPSNVDTSQAVNDTYSILIIVFPFLAFGVYWWFQKGQQVVTPYEKADVELGDTDRDDPADDALTSETEHTVHRAHAVITDTSDGSDLELQALAVMPLRDKKKSPRSAHVEPIGSGIGNGGGGGVPLVVATIAPL